MTHETDVEAQARPGWRWVPEKPTEAMASAGMHRMADMPEGLGWAGLARFACDLYRAMLTAAPEAPSTAEAGVRGLPEFLTHLRQVNSDRYDAWVDGEDAGIMFDAIELGGEVGELLNVVKKLEREARGWRGSRASVQDFADECADVLICLDKLARRHNIDLAAATVAKFNATSDKVGLPHHLALRAPSVAEEDVNFYAGLYADRCGDVWRLREALEPFALMAEHVEHTDKRDGDVVHRQSIRGGGYAELTKQNFRNASVAYAAALGQSAPKGEALATSGEEG